jgi:hypothetical protein
MSGWQRNIISTQSGNIQSFDVGMPDFALCRVLAG